MVVGDVTSWLCSLTWRVRRHKGDELLLSLAWLTSHEKPLSDFPFVRKRDRESGRVLTVLQGCLWPFESHCVGTCVVADQEAFLCVCVSVG